MSKVLWPIALGITAGEYTAAIWFGLPMAFDHAFDATIAFLATGLICHAIRERR